MAVWSGEPLNNRPLWLWPHNCRPLVGLICESVAILSHLCPCIIVDRSYKQMLHTQDLLARCLPNAPGETENHNPFWGPAELLLPFSYFCSAKKGPSSGRDGCAVCPVPVGDLSFESCTHCKILFCSTTRKKQVWCDCTGMSLYHPTEGLLLAPPTWSWCLNEWALWRPRAVNIARLFTRALSLSDPPIV